MFKLATTLFSCPKQTVKCVGCNIYYLFSLLLMSYFHAIGWVFVKNNCLICS